MKISKSVLARTAKATAGNTPALAVEKSSIAPNGRYGKVLFRFGTSKELASKLVKDRKALVEAFDAKLGGTAHLVVASVHATDVPDLFCGYIKLNDERMSFDMGPARGFREITANMFADPDDKIWQVQESADGKILVRNSEDNLQDLLNTKTPSLGLHVAASRYDLTAAVVAGQLVAYYDNNREEVRKGIMVDNASVYDFNRKAVVEVASCDLVAATGVYKEAASALDKLFNDPNKKFTELAAASKANVTRYITQLYGHNKAFLDAYLKKIDELLTV